MAFSWKGVRGRPDEALALEGMVSQATGRPYAMTWIYGVFRVPRSTVYPHRARTPAEASPGKRGPRTAVADERLLEEIRRVIRESPFHGEGHRKVTVRIRARGFRVGKNRVLRLMREHGLLAPTREGFPNGDPAHQGTITTLRPNELWDTDVRRFPTRENGWCWFFGAVDYCTNEVVGWHVAQKGDRWAALAPIRQGVTRRFGRYEAKIARGLGLRRDWGPQYTANRFTGEFQWLGIRSSPTYVGEPECNGLIERWLRTLKEECLYLHDFGDLEEARQAIGAFVERYNRESLIERYTRRAPTEARKHLSNQAA